MTITELKVLPRTLGSGPWNKGSTVSCAASCAAAACPQDSTVSGIVATARSVAIDMGLLAACISHLPDATDERTAAPARAVGRTGRSGPSAEDDPHERRQRGEDVHRTAVRARPRGDDHGTRRRAAIPGSVDLDVRAGRHRGHERNSSAAHRGYPSLHHAPCQPFAGGGAQEVEALGRTDWRRPPRDLAKVSGDTRDSRDPVGFGAFRWREPHGKAGPHGLGPGHPPCYSLFGGSHAVTDGVRGRGLLLVALTVVSFAS